MVQHRRHDGPHVGERILTALRVLLARLLGLGRKPAELDAEFTTHVELLAADLESEGHSPDAARAEARVDAQGHLRPGAHARQLDEHEGGADVRADRELRQQREQVAVEEIAREHDLFRREAHLERSL